MYQIFWYYKSQGWFSTSHVYARYRSDTWAVQQVKAEIDRNLAYWDVPVTFSISYDGLDVTEWYQEQVKLLEKTLI